MQDEPSDVLVRFQRGQGQAFVDAFEWLFRTHQRAVYGWIVRLVRDRAAAEELTVEAFWRIHRAHARFDATQGFERWARVIATHVALDWLRRQRREVELPADVPAPVAGDPGVAEEMRRAMADAFARLPAKLRAAATLAVVEELPHKEIAEALGVSVAAVKVRVFRALRQLRRDLEQRGMRP